jgi:hypothetical protein
MATCPQCAAELDPGAPSGLCPKCLIQGAFDTLIGPDQPETRTFDTDAARDDDFGRYQILRPIGEGGMGTVYLARQREPIRRFVALKVVKLGMDTGQVITRFEHERQALAMMDHPISPASSTQALRLRAGPTSSWSTSRGYPSRSTAMVSG